MTKYIIAIRHKSLIPNQPSSYDSGFLGFQVSRLKLLAEVVLTILNEMGNEVGSPKNIWVALIHII